MEAAPLITFQFSAERGLPSRHATGMGIISVKIGIIIPLSILFNNYILYHFSYRYFCGEKVDQTSRLAST